MNKLFKFIIILGALGFCLWLLWPSIKWYYVLPEETKDAIKITNLELKNLSEQLDDYVGQLRELVKNRRYWKFYDKHSNTWYLDIRPDTEEYYVDVPDKLLEKVVFKELEGEEKENKIIEFNELQRKVNENIEILDKINKLKELKSKTFSLGLDLAGGTQFVLDMNKSILKEKIERDFQDRSNLDNADARKNLEKIAKERYKDRNPDKGEPSPEELESLIQEIIDQYREEKDMKIANIYEKANTEARKIIQERVDKFGLAEVQISSGFGDRIIVDIPGTDKDIVEIRSAITEVGNLAFHLVDEKAMEQIPGKYKSGRFIKERISEEEIREYFSPGSKLFPFVESSTHGVSKTKGLMVLKGAPEFEGEIDNAGVDFDQTGHPSISFQLSPRGASIFCQVTTENAGKRRLAIVLDGNIKSAPSISGPICQGNAQITGDFTLSQARSLAAILEAGNLPTALEIVSERAVGAALGVENIKIGFLAAFIGFSMVMFFMLLYYKVSGIIADFALILNLYVVFAILSGFSFTLSLPGIAGLVLSMAMSIDANVIIFERIREEIREGKRPEIAIEAGYAKAFRAIFDANLTTIFAGIVLANLGTGILKGFGITLTCGILASMFTALFVTRFVLDLYYKIFKPKKLSV